MLTLVDTNILVRLKDLNDLRHREAAALEPRFIKNPNFFIANQSLFEYWVVATRPRAVNGLGLKPDEADKDIDRFLRLLKLVPDPPDLLSRWRHLVRTHSISGLPAHDARLVAVMDYHRIAQVLTFNTGDFSKFTHIKPVTPLQIISMI